MILGMDSFQINGMGVPEGNGGRSVRWRTDSDEEVGPVRAKMAPGQPAGRRRYCSGAVVMVRVTRPLSCYAAQNFCFPGLPCAD